MKPRRFNDIGTRTGPSIYLDTCGLYQVATAALPAAECERKGYNNQAIKVTDVLMALDGLLPNQP